MIFESCCNSVLFNFDAQKLEKSGKKGNEKTTKEIKALQQFTNLKSLGVKSVPVQVRSAAPKRGMNVNSYLFSFYIFCTPKQLSI